MSGSGIDAAVLEYLAGLPAERKAVVQRFHDLITSTAPQLDARYWDYGGGLIGYGTYHYRTKSGLEGDWFAIGVGNRKGYVSLYSNAARDGSYLVEHYAPELPGTKLGKSCINVYKPELIADDVIRRLVAETVAYFWPA